MNAYNYPMLTVSHVPQEEEKKTKKGVSIQMYQRGRTILGGARARGGGVGASDLIRDLSVKPFTFFSVACIALEPFIRSKRRTTTPMAT